VADLSTWYGRYANIVWPIAIEVSLDLPKIPDKSERSVQHLGAELALCKQEVTGSIPVGSTRCRYYNDPPANSHLLMSGRSGRERCPYERA